jgi:hypothetical protein
MDFNLHSEDIDDFTEELGFGLRKRFRALASQINGDGKPTGRQITACVLEAAADVQRYSSGGLNSYGFERIMKPFLEDPEIVGRCLMPLYDACCNGKNNT